MNGVRASGNYEAFADGFAGKTPLMQQADAASCPSGLAQGPDGRVHQAYQTHLTYRSSLALGLSAIMAKDQRPRTPRTKDGPRTKAEGPRTSANPTTRQVIAHRQGEQHTQPEHAGKG